MFGTYWTSRLHGAPLMTPSTNSCSFSFHYTEPFWLFLSFVFLFFSRGLFLCLLDSSLWVFRGSGLTLPFWLNMPSWVISSLLMLWDACDIHFLNSKPPLRSRLQIILYLRAICFWMHTSFSVWVRVPGLFCLPCSLCQGHHQPPAL